MRTRTAIAVGQLAPHVDRPRRDRARRSREQLAEARHGQVDDLGVGAPARTGPTPRSAARGAASVRAMSIGRNHAISSSTSVVPSSISVSAPPMIPAMPIGAVVAVADQQVVGGERALDVVERDQRLPVAAPAARGVRATRQLGEVVRVVRLPELEHHVVGDVDHVVDRPHAEQRQPGGHRRRRRPDRRRRASTRADEPAAEVGIDDLDRRQVGRRTTPCRRARADRAGVNGTPRRAARSRATPATDIASGRLGLTSRS